MNLHDPDEFEQLWRDLDETTDPQVIRDAFERDQYDDDNRGNGDG